MKHCHDCNVKEGDYHIAGCDWERCPHCGGQYISCGCDDAEVHGLDRIPYGVEEELAGSKMNKITDFVDFVTMIAALFRDTNRKLAETAALFGDMADAVAATQEHMVEFHEEWRKVLNAKLPTKRGND